MFKALVFDMDGTIANLYGVDGWLADLRSYNARPYEVAEPFYNMSELSDTLNTLKEKGWTIIITSWLSKESIKEYDEKVRKAKRNWLNRHNFPYDECHFVKYGTTKADCTRKKGGYQILIDDVKKIRDGWHLGSTIDAENQNILTILKNMAAAE